VLASTAGGLQAQTLPQAIRIDSDQGKALVRLAKTAMSEYLSRRTPADKQPIPGDLAGLSGTECATTVTLRSDGEVKAQVVQGGTGIARNVVAAALKAMRSSGLPDRVSQSVLQGLTVEVEILGPSLEAAKDDLAGLIRPGLTGVVASRNGHKAYLLPSVAYERGLDPNAIVAETLRRLGTVPQDWAVFTSRHFVGYPDGQVVELFCGRLTSQPKDIDQEHLAAAALSIGRHLVRCQDPKTGRYGTAAGPATDLLEHLHATYALCLLAKRTGAKDFSKSVEAALTHVVSSIAQDRRRAYVTTENIDDRVAATAWLLLVLHEQANSPHARNLKDKAAVALRDAIGEGEALVPRLSNQPPRHAASLGSESLAYISLKRTLPKNDCFADDKLPAVLKSIVKKAGLAGSFSDPKNVARAPVADLIWAARAITAGEFGPSGAYAGNSAEFCSWLERQLAPGPSQGDEEAGIPGADKTISTATTALAATMAAEACDRWRFRFVNPERQAKALVRKLTSFCYRMTYRPAEAFFAAEPSNWVGAVRVRPDSAAVSVQACAAAIEAMLSARANR
jgi:AMMECR1 domain-containing protein